MDAVAFLLLAKRKERKVWSVTMLHLKKFVTKVKKVCSLPSLVENTFLAKANNNRKKFISYSI